LKKTQEKKLETHNDNRKEKQYHVEQVVYEKKYGERSKLKPRYKKQIVATVETESFTKITLRINNLFFS